MLSKRFLLSLILLAVLIYVIFLGASFYLKGKPYLEEKSIIRIGLLVLLFLFVSIIMYFRIRDIIMWNSGRKYEGIEPRVSRAEKKSLEDAIKRRDIGTLWNIAQDYKERWLVEEYLRILRIIRTYDPNGSYGREAKKILLEFNSASPFDKQQLRDIERASAKLDRNPEDYDAWLELADAHARAGLYKDAREIYIRTVECSANSNLKEYAKNRLDELNKKKVTTGTE
jgi:hypothetical protein